MNPHRRAFCAFCQGERAFTKPAIDHRFHRALCILTCGLWALVWLGVFFHRCARRPWRCGCCGHRLRRSSGAARAAGGSALARRSGTGLDPIG